MPTKLVDIPSEWVFGAELVRIDKNIATVRVYHPSEGSIVRKFLVSKLEFHKKENKDEKKT